MNQQTKAEAFDQDAIAVETSPKPALVAVTVAAPEPAPEPEPEPEPAAPRPRKWRRTLLMLAVPAALIAGGGYVWLNGGRFETTENANLHQARVSISAEVPGRIVSIDVAENQVVHAGDVLFQVDPQQYTIALQQADAALSAARISVAQLKAAYGLADAQAKAAADDVAYFQSEYDRQRVLTDRGIASASAMSEAERNISKAEEAKMASDQAVQSALAALGGDLDIDPEQHPLVLAAQAARDKAAWDLERTVVRAPGDGVVYQAASFREGQVVGAGTALFALVETGDTWIEANFKETQLTNLSAGQPAEVEFDTYPGHVFEATVEAIGAGTGAEFSLLPAQNATGNWVKVTQRVPVRLRLADGDDGLALLTGMSAAVSVDTGVSRSLTDLVSWTGLVN